jgi:hypothetical protein
VKRLIRLAALAATLAAALYAPAVGTPASIDDGATHGPACADIKDGGLLNPDPAPLQTLQFAIITAKPSCSDVNYTLTVTYQTASGPATVSTTVQGNGFVDTTSVPPQPLLAVSIDLPGNTGTTVCVSATTSDKKGQVFDNAPDEGCASLDTTPSSSPFTGFH